MKRTHLITKPCKGKVQHTEPCTDCPWARAALPGWTGALPPEDWVQVAHRDDRVECHTISNMQCAGLAVYRRNVAKSPRDPKILSLPADRVRVFATPMEFLKHHGKK